MLEILNVIFSGALLMMFIYRMTNSERTAQNALLHEISEILNYFYNKYCKVGNNSDVDFHFNRRRFLK